MSEFEQYLAGFSEDPGYLDFAHFGPLATIAAEETTLHSELLSRSRYGSLDHLEQSEERMRQAVASHIGFDASEIVFQRSVENAYFQVFFGLNQGLLISATEQPSAVYAAVRAQQALGRLVTIWMATDYDRITPSVVREQLTAGTGAVFVSLVDHRTGHVIDLEGIREVIGDRLLILDASQGVGVISAPYQLADVVIGSGSRWLRAGHGTGFLAISELAQSLLKPVLSGLSGSQQPDITNQVAAPRAGAAAFQLSESDPVAHARLAVVLEQINQVGIQRIHSYLQQRVDAFIDLIHEFNLSLLSPLVSEERAGIVSVAVEHSRISPVMALLHNQGVTATQQEYGIRFSVHPSTTDETFAMVREALAASLNS